VTCRLVACELRYTVARGHRLERRRVRHIRPSTQQQRIDLLHQRQEGLADVIVPVGQCPAAVLEPSISILVFATRRLHHAVQRHELGDNQLSHGTFRLL
jgi:hypothetical protein